MAGPFRAPPETVSRIMVTSLAAMAIPTVAVIWRVGLPGAELISVAVLTALITAKICKAVRHETSPGTIAHSTMMGLLVALTLPAVCRWYIVMTAVVCAIVIGKELGF